MERESTGTVLDKLLAGGLEPDCITTIYGPAGAGKTNLALLSAVTIALTGAKVIYVDTEGGFSVERLKQLTAEHEQVMERILFLKPTTFQEQVSALGKLKSLASKSIGVIVVDTISMLYRLELGD